MYCVKSKTVGKVSKMKIYNIVLIPMGQKHGLYRGKRKHMTKTEMIIVRKLRSYVERSVENKDE